MVILPMLVTSETVFLFETVGLLEPLEFITIYAAIAIAATATKKPAISIGFLLFLDLCIRRRCDGITTVPHIV
jgi:hypothetical protein